MHEEPQSRRWPLQLLLAGIIVALLAGLAFPPLGNGMVSTPEAQSTTMCNQIGIACELYKTEYGTYPSTTENYRLYQILNGSKLGNDNPRSIQFMSFNKKDLNPNVEIIDAWGTPL